MQLHIENPTFLWGFAFVIGLGWLMFRHRSQHPSSFSWRRFSIILLAFTFGILALCRPQLGRRVTAAVSRSSQIFFAIDISKSMLAQDATPSRLQFAISFTQKLLGELEGSKVAIFPFAADGYLQVPLTSDAVAASDMVSLLTPGLTTQQGTHLTRSLTTLLTQIDRLEQLAKEKGSDWLPTEVILISDGESHYEIGTDVLKQFRSRRIPIFTVGTGSRNGTYIPSETRLGMHDRLKDNEGKPVLTKLNADSLQTISKVTGGDYFAGRFEEVSRLKERLGQVMAMGKLSSTFKSEKEIFPLLLTLALICFLFEFSLGRWEFTIRTVLWVVAVAQVLFTSPSLAADISEPIADEKKPSAIESYNSALKEVESNPAKAAELFQESATLSDSPEVKKRALFNLGNALIKTGDPVQALQAYQQAFDTKVSDEAFNQEANQKISENLVLAAKIIEEMKRQQQEEPGQGDPKNNQEGKNGKATDPKGPQKDYDAQLFDEKQKKKIFDLIASDEQQTMQRVQGQRNRNQPISPTEKPW